jgi:branched-chain amino acid transport system permease protein
MKGILRRLDTNFVVLGGVLVVLAPVPLFLSRFQVGLAVEVLLFALLGVAWNLMSGFSGQFSFGHAAFFGLGAYSTAYLVINYDLSPWIAMFVGALLAAALGAFIGYLSFRYRVKGVYFALTTLAFAEMLRLISRSLELVNGPRGMEIPFLPGVSWWMMQFPLGSPLYYYLALFLLAGAIIITILLIKSRTGMFVLALREDEDAAQALGINPLSYRLLAIAVSAALTAVGGTFYVQHYSFIDPNLAFGAALSVAILLPAIVGGMGTIWGPVLGSAVVVAIGEMADSIIRRPPPFLGFVQGSAGLDLIIYGVVLIIIVLFLPKGILGSLTETVQARVRARSMSGRRGAEG